jgi:S-layer protein
MPISIAASLTTGIDTISGTSNMAVVGTGTTFTAYDSITGTGTNNSLTVTDTTGASATGAPTGVSVSGIQTFNLTSTGTIGATNVTTGAISAASGVANVLTVTNSGVAGTPVAFTKVALTVNGVTVDTGTLGANNTTRANLGTAAASLVTKIFGDAVTVSTPDTTTGQFTVTDKVTGQTLPGLTFTVTNGTGGVDAVSSSSTTAAVQAVLATGALAEFQTITLGGTAAAGDTYTLNYVNSGNVVQQLVYTGATQATAASQIAAQINALYGSTIATANGSVVNITGSAGTVLPIISVTTSQLATATSAIAQQPSIATSAGTTTTAATYDVSGFTGLTQFTTNSTGGQYVKAAATTALSMNDAGLAAGSITTTGGSNIVITTKGVTTGAITVGSSTAANQPTGTVAITSTYAAATAAPGAIQVNGGTAVTVNQVVTDTANADTVNQAAVTVNGGKVTTSVTVNQASIATGAAATTATAGTLSVNSTTAAPGVTGVTAVTGVAYVAKTAAATPTITDGAVAINDVNGTSNTAAGVITSVTLAGYGTASTIVDNALATLTVSGKPVAGSTLTVTDNLTAHTNGSTTLALNTNTFSTTGTIVDAKLGTLNVTNTGTSSFGGVSATSAKTITIAGSGTLTMPVNSTLNTALTALNISGSVGFADGSTAAATNVGLQTLGAALAITNTSSGTFTAAIDDTTQVYNGAAAGASTIYLAGDATKAITGNGAASEAILTATGNGAYTLAKFGTNVTGFGILGIDGSVNNGTIDMSQFNSGFNTIQTEATGSVAFTKVVAGTAINFNSGAGTDSFTFSDGNGATDTATVTLNATATTGALTVTALTLADKNGVGINTVNIVSTNPTPSAVGATTAGQNVITTLTDANLSVLNVSGSGDLLITNFISDINASIAINSNETGNIGTTITNLTDNALTALTFNGSNATTVTTLTDTGTTLSVTNAGTGIVTIAGGTLATNSSTGAAETLTLGANVAVGANTAGTGGLSLAGVNGITVSAGSDNAHINIALGAAVAGKTNTVTLGNANDSIVDATVQGTSNITVGSGANSITFSGTATTTSTGTFNVTLGAHTNTSALYNQITVAGAGVGYTNATVNTIITGAVKGDQVLFGLDTSSATTATAVTAAADLGTYMTNLKAALGTTNHAVAYFNFGGNTYIGELVGTTADGAHESLVEIVGGASHTYTLAAGSITLAS